MEYRHRLERVEFSRKTMQLDTRLSYISISDGLDMAAILRVNYHKLGLVHDLDCPGSQAVLNQV